MSLILALALLGTSPVALSSGELFQLPPLMYVAQAAEPAKLTADSSVDEVLLALQKRGQGLNAFSLSLKLTDTDAATGDDKVRTGKMWYSAAAGENVRLRVTMNDVNDGNGVRPDKIEYLLEHEYLIDRNYRKMIEVKRKVLKPGEKINLFKLGEGPFPLPIGQDPAEVRKQFAVAALAADAGRPGVTLTPVAGTRMAGKFKEIKVWVDPQTGFPTKIVTLDPNESKTTTTELADLVLNPAGGIAKTNFDLSPLPPNWTVTEEQYSD